MKRLNDGTLVFASRAEQEQYEQKKREFLSRSDEENARIFNRELLQKYGYEVTPEKVVAEVPSKPEHKIDKNLLVLAEQVSVLDKKVNALVKLVK